MIIDLMPKATPLIRKQQGEYEYQASIGENTTVLFNDASIEYNHLAAIQINDKLLRFRLRDAEPSETIVLEDSVCYPDSFEDVDMYYTVEDGQLKEDIMIKSKTANHAFIFDLESEGVTAELQEDNSIIYKDENQTALWTIKTPVAYDADGVEVPVLLDFNDLEYKLSIEPGDYAYPIDLDPTVELVDTFIAMDNPLLKENSYPLGYNGVDPVISKITIESLYYSSSGYIEFLDVSKVVITGTKYTFYSNTTRTFDVPDNAYYLHTYVNSIYLKLTGYEIKDPTVQFFCITPFEYSYTYGHEIISLNLPVDIENGVVELLTDPQVDCPNSIRIDKHPITNQVECLFINYTDHDLSFIVEAKPEDDTPTCLKLGYIIKDSPYIIDDILVDTNRQVEYPYFYKRLEASLFDERDDVKYKDNSLTLEISKVDEQSEIATILDDFNDGIAEFPFEGTYEIVSGVDSSSGYNIAGQQSLKVNRPPNGSYSSNFMYLSVYAAEDSQMTFWYKMDGYYGNFYLFVDDNEVFHANGSSTKEGTFSYDFLTPGMHYLKFQNKTGNYGGTLYLDDFQITNTRKVLDNNHGTAIIGPVDVSGISSINKTKFYYESDTPEGTSLALEYSADEIIWTSCNTEYQQNNDIGESDILYIKAIFDTTIKGTVPKLLNNTIIFKEEPEIELIPDDIILDVLRTIHKTDNIDLDTKRLEIVNSLIDLDTEREIIKLVGEYETLLDTERKVLHPKLIHTELFNPSESASDALIVSEQGIYPGERSYKFTEYFSTDIDWIRDGTQTIWNSEAININVLNILGASFWTTFICLEDDYLSYVDVSIYVDGVEVKKESPEEKVKGDKFYIETPVSQGEHVITIKYKTSVYGSTSMLLDLDKLSMYPQTGMTLAKSTDMTSNPFTIQSNFISSSMKFVVDKIVPEGSSITLYYMLNDEMTVWDRHLIVENEYMDFSDLKEADNIRLLAKFETIDEIVPIFKSVKLYTEAAQNHNSEILIDLFREVKSSQEIFIDTNRKAIQPKLMRTETFNPWESISDSAVIYDEGVTLGTEIYTYDREITTDIYSGSVSPSYYSGSETVEIIGESKVYEFSGHIPSNESYSTDSFRVSVDNDDFIVTQDSNGEHLFTKILTPGTHTIYFYHSLGSKNIYGTASFYITRSVIVGQEEIRQATSGSVISEPFAIPEEIIASTINFTVNKTGGGSIALYCSADGADFMRVPTLVHNGYQSFLDIDKAETIRLKAILYTNNEPDLIKLQDVEIRYQLLDVLNADIIIDVSRDIRSSQEINMDTNKQVLKSIENLFDISRGVSVLTTIQNDILRRTGTSIILDNDLERDIFKDINILSDTSRLSRNYVERIIKTTRQISTNNRLTLDIERPTVTSESLEIKTLRISRIKEIVLIDTKRFISSDYRTINLNYIKWMQGEGYSVTDSGILVPSTFLEEVDTPRFVTYYVDGYSPGDSNVRLRFYDSENNLISYVTHNLYSRFKETYKDEIPEQTKKIEFHIETYADSNFTLDLLDLIYQIPIVRHININIDTSRLISKPNILQVDTLRAVYMSDTVITCIDTLRKIISRQRTVSDTYRDMISKQIIGFDTNKRSKRIDSLILDTSRIVARFILASIGIDTTRIVFKSIEALSDTQRQHYSSHNIILDSERKIAISSKLELDTLRQYFSLEGRGTIYVGLTYKADDYGVLRLMKTDEK